MLGPIEAFSAAFVDKLATDLELGLNTTLTLKNERLSPAFLLAINRQDLERVYLIDAKDALKLSMWAQRKAREAKLALAKFVSIYNSERDAYMEHTFYGQSDLTSLLGKWQSAGLEASAPMSDDDEPQSSSSSSARKLAVMVRSLCP